MDSELARRDFFRFRRPLDLLGHAGRGPRRSYALARARRPRVPARRGRARSPRLASPRPPPAAILPALAEPGGVRILPVLGAPICAPPCSRGGAPRRHLRRDRGGVLRMPTMRTQSQDVVRETQDESSRSTPRARVGASGDAPRARRRRAPHPPRRRRRLPLPPGNLGGIIDAPPPPDCGPPSSTRQRTATPQPPARAVRRWGPRRAPRASSPRATRLVRLPDETRLPRRLEEKPKPNPNPNPNPNPKNRNQQPPRWIGWIRRRRRGGTRRRPRRKRRRFARVPALRSSRAAAVPSRTSPRSTLALPCTRDFECGSPRARSRTEAHAVTTHDGEDDPKDDRRRSKTTLKIESARRRRAVRANAFFENSTATRLVGVPDRVRRDPRREGDKRSALGVPAPRTARR